MNPVTGKIQYITLENRTIRYLNQRSLEWTHPYAYLGGGETLKNAGCGIFALAHAAEWMHGLRIDCEALADFSCAHGGRGDDGTDRPVLLTAMMAHGLAREMGFAYDFGGLRNDPELLWQHLSVLGNTALCNLRVGHIVALLGARVSGGRRQLLAIDSVAESQHEKVRDHVAECAAGTLVSSWVKNASGLVVGRSEQYAAFWVDAELPRDVNLLTRIDIAP